MARRTQAALEGQPWTQKTLDSALLAVAQDVSITPDAPGASHMLHGLPCAAPLTFSSVGDTGKALLTVAEASIHVTLSRPGTCQLLHACCATRFCWCPTTPWRLLCCHVHRMSASTLMLQAHAQMLHRSRSAACMPGVPCPHAVLAP